MTGLIVATTVTLTAVIVATVIIYRRTRLPQQIVPVDITSVIVDPAMCINGDKHIPLIMITQHGQPLGSRCRICSDELTPPQWMTCPVCRVVSITPSRVRITLCCEAHGLDPKEPAQ